MNLLDKDVLTTGEVAKLCNVASRTVSKWFDSGQLNGYRIPGSKDRRIPVASLLKFMRDHGIPMDGLMSGAVRVLVVDSDEDVRQTLARILQDQTNYEVRSASSCFKAGIECERFRPHVMLLDLTLAAEEESVAMELVDNNNSEAHSTKVIAVTGKLTDGQIAQLAHQGFESVLRKPFSVRQVIESIENAHAVVY